MTPEDLNRVIAGMSEAQKRLILGNAKYVRAATYERLIKDGLLYRVGGFVIFTPLGLAIRARLGEGK